MQTALVPSEASVLVGLTLQGFQLCYLAVLGSLLSIKALSRSDPVDVVLTVP